MASDGHGRAGLTADRPQLVRCCCGPWSKAMIHSLSFSPLRPAMRMDTRIWTLVQAAAHVQQGTQHLPPCFLLMHAIQLCAQCCSVSPRTCPFRCVISWNHLRLRRSAVPTLPRPGSSSKCLLSPLCGLPHSQVDTSGGALDFRWLLQPAAALDTCHYGLMLAAAAGLPGELVAEAQGWAAGLWAHGRKAGEEARG